MRKGFKYLLGASLFIGFMGRTVRAEDRDALLSEVRNGMRKAGETWAGDVASHGGYVWEYSTDLVTRRRGESKNLPLSTVWVQAGTPMVGEAFLRAYEVTGEAAYLEAALNAGRCLSWGQLQSGGWGYSIEFDLDRNHYKYHHLDDPQATNNTTTFDDDNTQSATRFLMHLDRWVDEREIDASIERALDGFLEAQYEEMPWKGAWPQRYPPPKGYAAFPTFNDNTMSDCVRTMFMAYEQYGNKRALRSVKDCLDFYLRSQREAPQSTWAQQYDEKLEPAWARKFEPPSVSGAESCGNCNLLMDIYLELGDEKLLDAVGRTVDWYEASRIGGTEEEGVWARFYELETNKPLYFTKTYELVYTDDDLPIHYSFKGNYGVNGMISRYETIRKTGREALLAEREKLMEIEEWADRAKTLAEGVRAVLDAMDEKGRWVKKVPKTEQKRDEKGRVVRVVDKNVQLEMMYTRGFVQNLRTLADYVEAAQGGPKRR